MSTYKNLDPHPTGWFAVAFAKDVKTKEVTGFDFMDREMVIYRTESGKVVVMDAHCIHMGAHFAYGGTVEGEDIRCPFHGFCFDTEGKCTKTGYGTKPSPRLKMRIWPTMERNGLILLWYSRTDQEPEWEVPELDFDGWTDIVNTNWEFEGHPQETSENSVDVGHFSITHGYDDVVEIEPMTSTGPYLTARYGFSREGFLPKISPKIRTEFKVHVHGLGYSLVESEVKNMGLNFRHFILSTPTSDNQIKLRIGLSLKKIEKPAKVNPFLAVVPKPMVNNMLLSQAFKGFAHDVTQDFDVWKNKKYVDPPYLAKGDGPVMQYRKWCEQFYD